MMSSVSLKNIHLTIGYDNYPYKDGLTTGWGFSCLIQGTEKTILLDTGGNSRTLLRNLHDLGINIQEIDLVFLSHIHEDHVGGLKGFLRQNRKVNVCFPSSFPARFKTYLARYGVQTRVIQEPALICKSVYSTGELGMWIKEQSLIIHTVKGIILITGCAHPGIVNIIKAAKALVGDNILLVIGGFHLSGASKFKIETIIDKMKALGVSYIGPCHCSGELVRQTLKNEHSNLYVDVGVGRIIKIKSL
jgi:7,8-dihydropterin-6-yl-methyl-4-(beta-D-ribofuranosyl)aminobenzene 5'-phosphate synthase